jgi:hypothetical protein
MPKQRFDSQAQFDFGKNLSYHARGIASRSIVPLGNQSRARRRMYWELRRLRQTMNGTPHIEPNGTRCSRGRPRSRYLS